MKLSANFTVDELSYSETAQRLNIDNTPGPDVLKRLQDLCDAVLQPARNALGPIHISSGYRCHVLNSAVGGAENSQHALGEAADITSDNFSNHYLAAWILENTEFDQLILEPGWVHVSFRAGRNRQDVLTAKRSKYGKMIYKFGLL